jgi:hypothetical protein
MALNIDTEEAHRLAMELARVTGESLADAVTTALRERVRPQESPGLSEPADGDREGDRLAVEGAVEVDGLRRVSL